MDNRKQSNMYCFISLGCVLGALICLGLSQVGLPYRLELLNESALSLGLVAAFVFMIVARVIDKTNIFAKVLMWIYIVIMIIGFIMIAILVVFFALICSSCMGSGDSQSFCETCYACGQIGITYISLFLLA